jgi:hypothetical protein
LAALKAGVDAAAATYTRPANDAHDMALRLTRLGEIVP